MGRGETRTEGAQRFSLNSSLETELPGLGLPEGWGGDGEPFSVLPNRADIAVHMAEAGGQSQGQRVDRVFSD